MTLITDHKIIDDILKQIDSKILLPGKKLPSESELVERYRVPRMTVRSALVKLEERGIVYSIQGKGRYLKEKSKQIQLQLTGKISFTDKMEQFGYDLTTKNISFTPIHYDEKIFTVLNAKKTDIVFQIGRLRMIDNEPIAIHNSFVREANFPKLHENGNEIKSMFNYYRKHGYDNFSSRQSILSVTFPTVEEQQLLVCKSMVPILVLETDCIDTRSKKVLEYTKILYRSDKFNYDITID